jgi:hypothetical protein
MISSEVQRTLVKSPPELWAELSDPDALARHLSELGDVRIVRAEPEKTVEWAAENTAGTVSIQPSGWGTKVTLSVTRQIAERAPAAESPPETMSEPDATPKAAAEPEPEPEPASRGAPEPASTMEAEPVDVAEPTEPDPKVESQPRRGFFARLFGRHRRAEPPEIAEEPASAEPPARPDAFAAVREVLAPETFAAEHPFAAPSPETTPAPEAPASEQETAAGQMSDLSAELMAAEEAGTEEVTAVLTAVLDRLGAAHHRPFSRA